MDSTSERGRELFEGGYYCAESVLLAVAESRGVDCRIIPRIATGLCSGIARTSGMCGAVLGAILAIGAAIGRNDPSDSVEPTYAAVRGLLERFEQEHGSTNCRTLSGCDLATDEGQIAFRKTNQRKTCSGYVADGVRFALDAIEWQEAAT